MAKLTRRQKRWILRGCLFALTFGVTALIRVKTGITYPLGNGRVNAGVYATLGDVCVFVNVLLLGGPWGAGISAASMALADLAVGSKLYIIGTLLIKTGMAFFIAAFCTRCDGWGRSFAVSGVAEAIMVAGYFLYNLVIVREFVVAGQALLIDLAQGAVCAVAGGLILHYLPPVNPEKLPVVKRRARARYDGDDFDYER